MKGKMQSLSRATQIHSISLSTSSSVANTRSLISDWEGASWHFQRVNWDKIVDGRGHPNHCWCRRMLDGYEKVGLFLKGGLLLS